MTHASPSGARPRQGRPRHQQSPRARIRARQGVEAKVRQAAATPVDAAVAATQLTSVVEVDLTGVTGDLVLVTVATAAIRSTGHHPSVAGRVDPDTGVIVRAKGVHLGVLADDGTTHTVVENADDLTATALARQLADGHRDDVIPTLSVVDTGSLGALMDTPVLGRDRASVLGIGAVVRRLVVMPSDGGEAIAVRAMAHLSLSYDPVLLRGTDAARFLHAVRQAIEKDDS